MKLVEFENIFWDLPILLGNNIVTIDNLVEGIHEIDNFNPIKYLHGSITCKWNGEEAGLNQDVNSVAFPKCIYDKRIRSIVTFSAYNLDDEDLNDDVSNKFLDIIMELRGEVEVSSDKLYNHIKSRYPNSTLVASNVKSYYELEQGKEVDYYKRLLDKYDRVILSTQYVKNGFLNDLDKFSDTSRFEIIANDRCVSTCNLRKEHYLQVEKNNIDFMKGCPLDSMPIRDLYNNSLALSKEEIKTISERTNITNFRLNGRNLKYNDLKFVITSYMFKKYGISTFFIYSIR